MKEKNTPKGPVRRVLGAINRALIKLGHLIGSVVNPVVMAVVYLLVLGPVSLLSRLSGGDPLRLKFRSDGGTGTYYEVHQSTNDSVGACRRQF